LSDRRGYDREWRNLRRRRLILLLALLYLFAVVTLILPHLAPYAPSVARWLMLASPPLVIAAYIYLWLFPCPRCGALFFDPFVPTWQGLIIRRCRHCNLLIGGTPFLVHKFRD
jgi:hypothetical protein